MVRFDRREKRILPGNPKYLCVIIIRLKNNIIIMNLENHEPKSAKDIAAEKLGLDPKDSSIKDVMAAMLGLDPKNSSMRDVDEAMSKLSPEEKMRIEMLEV